MSKRNVALLVIMILLIGAIAGLARHLGDYAQPVREEGGTVTYLVFGSQPAGVVATKMANLETPAVEGASPNQIAAGTAQDLLSDPGVVGQPFELSKSVQANCRLFEGDCQDLDTFLERMAAEPRNEEWAHGMEARIEKAVMSGERGKFRIRALECRSTRCALEVASEVDRFGLTLESDPGFNDVMFPRMGYFADESDPQTGVTTLVGAHTWQTWESFNAEREASE